MPGPEELFVRRQQFGVECRMPGQVESSRKGFDMSRKLLVTSFLVLMIASTAATSQIASPPRWGRQETITVQKRTEPSGNAVTAIIVKSWGNNPVWADLNTNWSTYGTIPVSIDYTTLIDGDFTYTDLVDSNADVVILSDPAGGLQQYSSAEVTALAKYIKAGHVIVGTFLTFQYQKENIDNRALAPIFGLSSSLTYTYFPLSNEFTKVADACLFSKIPGPLAKSNGYPNSQVPSSGTWMGSLGAAMAGAESDSYVGVITGYRKKSATAIYISSMPEFQTTGGDDEQFLYNAITCYVAKTVK